MNHCKKLVHMRRINVALLTVATAQTVEKKTLTLQGAEQVIAAAKNEPKSYRRLEASLPWWTTAAI